MRTAPNILATLKFVLVWALVLFFIAGGIGNLFPPDTVRADYARWGYPGWFHYVTGVMELVVAALIAHPATRLAGSILGCLIMGSAFVTLLLHGEYSHAIAPTVILALLFLSIRFTARAKRVA